METFAPVNFDDLAPLAFVQIGEAPPFPARSLGTHQRCIERLTTRAVFHAACEATGCRNGYQLEQEFGPTALIPGETLTAWNARREQVWERWRRGDSGIPSLLGRGSSSVEARLALVRKVSPLADQVLQMSFWRYLDPRPLTTAELVPASESVDRYFHERPVSPVGLESVVASQADLVLRGLADIKTRYDAMSGIWLRMRSSSMLNEVGPYALYFLCWLKARPLLERDPIFKELVPDLYDYTTHNFSRVALMPANQRTFAAAISSLHWICLRPTRTDGEMGTSVGLDDLAKIVDQSSKARSRTADLEHAGTSPELEPIRRRQRASLRARSAAALAMIDVDDLGDHAPPRGQQAV